MLFKMHFKSIYSHMACMYPLCDLYFIIPYVVGTGSWGGKFITSIA